MIVPLGSEVLIRGKTYRSGMECPDSFLKPSQKSKLEKSTELADAKAKKKKSELDKLERDANKEREDTIKANKKASQEKPEGNQPEKK